MYATSGAHWEGVNTALCARARAKSCECASLSWFCVWQDEHHWYSGKAGVCIWAACVWLSIYAHHG